MRYFFCLLSLIFALSCENESVDIDPNDPIDNNDNEDNSENSSNTAEEDQILVEDGIQSLLDCIAALESGNFSDLLINIYDNVDEDNSDFHEIMIEAIEDIPNYQPLIDSDYPETPLNISNYFGEYNYNDQNQSWSTSNSNSQIRLNFPMFTNSNSNDSYISLTNFEEELMPIEDPIYIPTSLYLEMVHSNELMFSVNVLDVEYSMSGEIPIPDDVNLSIYMNPFTHDISIDKLNDDDFNIVYSLTNSFGCITEIDARVKLLSTDYENLEDTDIDFIEINFTMNNILFDIDIDSEYLFALDDPSIVQLNNFIDVEVYNGNTLLGEIEVQEDSNEDYYFNMVFMDGTTTNVEEFSGIGINGDDFVETLEGIIARYTNRLDD
tara:strand:+ start:17083 stop:18222 length:1140 start_codon:yes stop_codon:yes gene_type:complete